MKVAIIGVLAVGGGGGGGGGVAIKDIKKMLLSINGFVLWLQLSDSPIHIRIPRSANTTMVL